MILKTVEIHTDGSCLGNPGPGGWAAVLRCDGTRREISGGYARTTNNRMEILGVIRALESLKEPCSVDLYTDSQYVAKAIQDRWLVNWRRNGWLTAAKKPVKNRDLWEQLTILLNITPSASIGSKATRATPKTNAATNWPAPRPVAPICRPIPEYDIIRAGCR